MLKFSKFWPVSWARDSSGVYYSRYPLKPGETADEAERGDDAGRPDVYFHKLGDAQSADASCTRSPIIRRACPPRRSPRTAAISSSTLFDGYETNGVLVQDLRKPGAKPQPLFIAWDALYNFIGSNGDELYFQTTNDAPRGRVIAVNAAKPEPAPGAPSCRRPTSPSASRSYIGGRIVVEYTRDARSIVQAVRGQRRAKWAK